MRGARKVSVYAEPCEEENKWQGSRHIDHIIVDDSVCAVGWFKSLGTIIKHVQESQ